MQPVAPSIETANRGELGIPDNFKMDLVDVYRNCIVHYLFLLKKKCSESPL